MRVNLFFIALMIVSGSSAQYYWPDKLPSYNIGLKSKTTWVSDGETKILSSKLFYDEKGKKIKEINYDVRIRVGRPLEVRASGDSIVTVYLYNDSLLLKILTSYYMNGYGLKKIDSSLFIYEDAKLRRYENYYNGDTIDCYEYSYRDTVVMIRQYCNLTGVISAYNERWISITGRLLLLKNIDGSVLEYKYVAKKKNRSTIYTCYRGDRKYTVTKERVSENRIRSKTKTFKYNEYDKNRNGLQRVSVKRTRFSSEKSEETVRSRWKFKSHKQKITSHYNTGKKLILSIARTKYRKCFDGQSSDENRRANTYEYIYEYTY